MCVSLIKFYNQLLRNCLKTTSPTFIQPQNSKDHPQQAPQDQLPRSGFQTPQRPPNDSFSELNWWHPCLNKTKVENREENCSHCVTFLLFWLHSWNTVNLGMMSLPSPTSEFQLKWYTACMWKMTRWEERQWKLGNNWFSISKQCYHTFQAKRRNTLNIWKTNIQICSKNSRSMSFNSASKFSCTRLSHH